MSRRCRGIRFRGALILVTAVAGLTACGGSDGVTEPPAPPSVASVEVAPAAASLEIGQTIQLSATTRGTNGSVISGRTVTWSSSEPSVARVSASGLVTGESGGNAQITATAEGVSGIASVAVTEGRVLEPSELCSASSPNAIATFEDANLEAAIRAHFETSPEDLSCSLLSSLVGVNAASLEITSLVGIQNLSNLTNLNLSFNQITDISAVSGLTSLEVLSFQKNQITDIKALSGLTSLRVLVVSFNEISDISALSRMVSR